MGGLTISLSPVRKKIRTHIRVYKCYDLNYKSVMFCKQVAVNNDIMQPLVCVTTSSFNFSIARSNDIFFTFKSLLNIVY